MNLWSKFRASVTPSEPIVFPSHVVDGPHYIIGDIHGRMDLLSALCDKIIHHAQTHPALQAAKVVYLGDYVDRGDQSAQVLGEVYKFHRAQPDRHICLMGNHEVMLLDFLDDPATKGNRWLRYGGMQTLSSYGIRGVRERMAPEDLDHIAAQLRDAMGADLIGWIRDMPKVYRTGNVVCTHAALNPAKPWDGQSDRARLWGHNDFFTTPRRDGLWVAHGHTIMDDVIVADGRMSLDTGAYATGRLTALGLYEDQAWVVQT